MPIRLGYSAYRNSIIASRTTYRGRRQPATISAMLTFHVHLFMADMFKSACREVQCWLHVREFRRLLLVRFDR